MDYLTSSYQVPVGDYVVRDCARVSHSILVLKECASGSVIAVDWEIVIVTATAQVPSGECARTSEVVVFPVGYHTVNKAMVSPCVSLRVPGVPARLSRIY